MGRPSEASYAGAMAAEIRRVRRGDAMALRELRLAALAESPAAFGSTHADEAEYPADVWRRRAELGAAGDETATFVAIEGDVWLGLAGGFKGRDEGVVELISMWVDPQARGRRLGVRLLDTVVDWSKEVDATSMELWVTVGNNAATRLYEHYGFSEVGDYQALPSDPCKNETRMRLELPTD